MNATFVSFLRFLARPGLWVACGAIFWATAAGAQSLAEAAKKEGKLVIYGSLESGIMDEIEKAFTKKYGIPIDYYLSLIHI